VRIETDRLVLRQWREDDAPLLATVIGDPVVRRFYPGVATLADAAANIARNRERIERLGYGFMAAELRSDGRFVGLLGLAPISEELQSHILGRPKVEIGWQLGTSFWGQGLAPEGATAMLDYAWRGLRLPEVVAFTYRGNLPSRRVMEKIGMTHDEKADFEHPQVPVGHLVRPHVLYRIANPAL
jgi:RimJ/RimL family protein N-acetyltransferase